MDLAGRGLLFASAVILLAHCKEKPSSGGAAANAAVPLPSATPGAAPPPSAAPLPSVAPLPPPLATLMGFEGEIDMMARSIDSGRPPEPVHMLVRGDTLRLDVIPGTDAAGTLGRKAFLLVRVAQKKLDVVTETKKQVIELDMTSPELGKAFRQMAPWSRSASKREPPPKLAKMGKDTIAGYACEDWELTATPDDWKWASLCVADLPSTFFHIPVTGLPSELGFAHDLIDGKHFPLRIVGYDDHTHEEAGRLEVTRVEPHPVDASKFEIPAGYQTIDMLEVLKTLAHPSLDAGAAQGVPTP
jgi:hypothetical protein